MQQYESHPITRDMAGITTLFPLTRSVAHGQDAAGGRDACRRWRRPRPDSWGETDRQALEQGQAKPDPQDAKGPLIAGRRRHQGQGADRGVRHRRTWPANQFLNVQGNRDFFLNTV